MNKLAIVAIGLTIFILNFSIISSGCTREELAPAQVPEPTIPADYSTYTVEGLYSISYPQDWVPATSIMDELWEGVDALMESEMSDVPIENVQMMFFGGLETDMGYNPNVSILVEPASKFFILTPTLDELVEAGLDYMNEAQGFQLFSQTKTTVDGREAVILDWAAPNDPLFYNSRFLQLITINDKYSWTVGCTSDYNDFENYRDMFNTVIRSLRILK